jgi:hypothetical protein
MYDSTTVAVEVVSLNIQSAVCRRNFLRLGARLLLLELQESSRLVIPPEFPSQSAVVCPKKQIGAERKGAKKYIRTRAIAVLLRETALNDSSLFVFELLRP